MAIVDKLGRNVPTVMVYNRTHLAAFKDNCHNVTLTEEFPFVGTVSVEPGEVAEVPADVAERWCDPERWSRQAGWPVKDGKVVPPVTKTIPASKVAADDAEDEAEKEDTPPVKAPVKAPK